MVSVFICAGIVHSEMPAVTDGDLHGFQLWINLPAKDKMVKPRYQDLQAHQIPTIESQPGASVRVMAGDFNGTVGPLTLRNPGLLFDVRLDPGVEWKQSIPQEWNGFAYIYKGSGKMCGTKAEIQHAYVVGSILYGIYTHVTVFFLNPT